MADFLSKIKNELLFLTILQDEDSEKIRMQVMRDNRKFVRIWSSVQLVYWIFCLVMSFGDKAYYISRSAYISALVICLFALFVSLIPGKLKPDLILLAALATDAALLFAGIWIAETQLSQYGRTIVLFASVLLVPVMFITNTLSSIVLMVLDIIAYAALMGKYVDGDVYSWGLTNLIIFSTVGILIGHFVNKTRFERYVFAQSVARLAELQTRYAYYDQMTGLLNRRAYEEKTEQLSKNLRPDCFMIMADINGLKEANDNIGHEAGDELIIAAAECLRQSFDRTDDVYRLGGDEFGVIMNGTKEEVEQDISRLEQISAGWNGKYIHGVSISCGYAKASEYPDFDAVAKAADEMMYAHKENYYRTSGRKKYR